MVALDDNHDPIYGPWEDKANADLRAEDVKTSSSIVSVKVESR
jgi:hypothetical protein